MSLRKKIVNICISNGGHIASSLSCVEILIAIYYSGILNIDPLRPDDKSRDRFLLSKGHAETVLFAILADLNFFPEAWLTEHYRKGDCRLGGHPDKTIPGVEVSTGSLGHGLGLASGMALAAKQNNSPQLYFVLMGDAECTEGSVWEAAMFAARNRLDRLVAIIDRNRIGSIDYTENFTSLEPFEEKWRAFGWETKTCDGHDIDSLTHFLRYAKTREDNRPLVLIASTVKGKGISFIENKPEWHVKGLVDEIEIHQARLETE